ncbi:histidine kinase [Pseudorhodoplanes sp.]|nr:histidine kinase [Pseudorhodoplanes sp.]HWV53445.1 histidine kinase [Pseudorhodoplanes sp.]
MPSLFRFLAAVAIVVGLIYGGMLALAVLVKPQSREISVTVPQDRFSKQR